MKYKVPHSSRAITAILLLLSPAVCSAVYYDSRDRAVQSVATNHLGGTDRSWTEYDFTGRPLRVRSEHRTPAMGADSAVVRTERRTYDRFGRELTLSHRYGDGAESREVTVRTNTYDAVGRLLTESLGDAAERTYEYDVRSRPVAITAYNYRQKLGFTYGGNVSRMTWWAYGPNETERSYTYSYDALSRLTEARYTDGEGGTGRYDVTYSYDLNGNVTALQRSGLYDNGSLKKYGLIDDLTLEYEGNMLRRVTDGCGAGPFYQGAYHFVDGADETQEYAYDGNGNTTIDLNRRVTAVGYDTNNRPRLIEFEGGSSTAYLYDAAGVKRRTVHRVATERPSVPGAEPQEPELSMTRTDYCGDIVYEDSLLSRINFDGGYLSFTNNAGERLDQPAYHFYHRDHLGNNRMDLGENGAVWQICHYYPYGMLMGCSYLGESQRWKFGGKELDRVSGLDLLDFEARPYDATLGRFWRPDDLADKYHPLSPFLYCAANPLVLVDRDGNEVTLYATNLPNAPGIFSEATHTFIAVTNSDGSLREYYCYGPPTDNFIYSSGKGIGKLTKREYNQDKNVISGTDTEHLKAAFTIAPPEGMTQKQFDDKVIETAESFGENPSIKYNILPTMPAEGNCNSSSSTILLKSGVSKKELEKIDKQIPGISWGFSSEPKPWTAEEQKEAVQGTDKAIRDRELLTR